jgi:hypothetical protein
MDRIHQNACSAEQSRILGLNAWKYACLDGRHVRIRPCTCDVAVLPDAPVNHVACIELLDAADPRSPAADDDAKAIVRVLFGSRL